MATRAADLSDEVPKAVFRQIEGGDPGERSREDLVAWLASKPDNEATNTAIEIARKQPRPPHDRAEDEVQMSKLARRRIEKRCELLEVEGVGIVYDGKVAQTKLDEEDPLCGSLRVVLIVGDGPVSVLDVCTATGYLAGLNKDHVGAIDKYSKLQPSTSLFLESDIESEDEDMGGSGGDLAHGLAAGGERRGRAVAFRSGVRRVGPSWKGRKSTSSCEARHGLARC